jgi:DNA-binding GntR family transcriptional regulator
VSTAGVRAYDHIRSLIIEGRVAPGERLKEEELTESCGVSRTPVREALRRLATEGLVVVTPNQGAQVAMLGSAELEEIYALRAMIEGHAAARAARRITPEQIVELKRLASLMEAAVESRSNLDQTFLPSNSAFHHLILDIAGSPRLRAMASLVVEIPLMVRTLARYSEAELQRSIQHHRELIAAFESGDEAWARSTMQSHVLSASHAVVRPTRDRPE